MKDFAKAIVSCFLIPFLPLVGLGFVANAVVTFLAAGWRGFDAFLDWE